MDAEGGDSGTPRFILHGFSDVVFQTHLNQPEGTRVKNAFTLGQFDLFMASQLSPTVSVLGELVYERDEDGSLASDLERIQIQWTRWDQARVTLGRVHTAMGFWNNMYHHGTFLQPTIERPQSLRFEDDGGVLPVHSVGVQISGRTLRGPWGLQYDGVVANGRSPRSTEVQTSGDLNDDKALCGRLTVTHDGDMHWEAGLTGYLDRIPALEAVRDYETDERISGVHVAVDAPRLQFAAEGYRITHDPRDAGNPQLHHHAVYALLVGRFGVWRPYALVDALRLKAADSFYDGGAVACTETRVGLRRELGAFTAIRAEVGNLHANGANSQVFAVQTSFAF